MHRFLFILCHWVGIGLLALVLVSNTSAMYYEMQAGTQSDPTSPAGVKFRYFFYLQDNFGRNAVYEKARSHRNRNLYRAVPNVVLEEDGQIFEVNGREFVPFERQRLHYEQLPEPLRRKIAKDR